jgi:glycosyltransferase involved in cell wall biosynthesis
MADLISVLLPVYNGEKYLRPAIESVLAQSYENLELIVCDDCSTDDSLTILQEYSARDERVKTFANSTQQGLFANYNKCWEKAQGELIKPFAQDDILYPDFLKLGQEILQERPQVKLVLTARNLIGADGEVIETVSPLPGPQEYAGKDLITWSLIFLTNKLGEPVTGIFRAADLTYGYDTRYFHYGDLELWFRLLFDGQLFFNTDVLCAFRRHEGGTTSANHRYLFDLVDALRLSRQYYAFLEQIGESKEHLYTRLIEYSALTVSHLESETGGNESMVRRRGPEPGPSQGVHTDDDFAELLYIALSQITPLIAELDNAKRGIVELDDLRRQMNSRSHQAVGWLMSKLRGAWR